MLTALEQRLDGLVALTSAWLVAGAWIDAWYHHRSEIESFFTPAHAVLYAGYVAAAATLLLASVRLDAGRLRVDPRPGYRGALIGVALFVLGGIADSIWHAILGIEEDVDALVSPTHLVLGVAAALIASGPIVAAWSRMGRATQSHGRPSLPWPAVISLALLTSMAGFFTAYASPFGLPLAAGGRAAGIMDLGVQQGVEDVVASPLLGQALGVASILLLSAIVVSAVLVAAVPWRAPGGSLTVTLGVGVGTSALPHESIIFLLAAIVAGVAVDGLVRALRPTHDRPSAVGWLGVLSPAFLVALYFAAIGLTVGIAWPVELWTGSIVLAGAVGLALTLVALAVGSSGQEARGTGAEPRASG